MEQTPPTTKTCIRCKDIKQVDLFGKNKRLRDGLNCYCLTCANKASIDRSCRVAAAFDPSSLPDQKRCLTCLETKEAGCFHLNRSTNDGLGYHCKECAKATKAQAFKTKQAVLAPDSLPEQKKCLRCSVTKPLGSFGKDRNKIDGRHQYCKPCASEVAKEASTRRIASFDPSIIRAEKRCPRCGDTKPAACFSVSKGVSGGLHSLCRECSNTTMTEARQEKRATDVVSFKLDTMLSGMRMRSRRLGTTFGMNKDILRSLIPNVCPILGLALNFNNTRASSKDSPSVDKVIPALGYVEGNVRITSQRGNTLKSDGTIEERQKLIEWIVRMQKDLDESDNQVQQLAA